MSLCDEINSRWEIFQKMPTGLQMQKIINIVGDRKWRDFLDDDISVEACEISIVTKARKRFEGEISEFFAAEDL